MFFAKHLTALTANSYALKNIKYEIINYHINSKDTLPKDTVKKTNITDSIVKTDICCFSSDSALISYFYAKDFHHPIGYNLLVKDSAIDYIHRHRLNYCGIKNFSHLGNIGTAIINREYLINNDLSLTFGKHAFTDYFYSVDSNKIYNCKHPISEVFYSAGPKKEQQFKIIHNQPIIENLAAGINYQLINSQGRYIAQGVNNSNLSTYLYYNTKNDNYKFFWNYIHNKIDIEENGGIEGEIEDYLNEKNKDVVPVRLTNDKQAKNRLKESVFFLEQTLKLWKANPVHVCSPNIRRKYAAGGAISHAFQYKKQRLIYEHSNDSTFYDNNYFSSTQTYDSTLFQQIQNFITLSNGFVYNKKNQKAALLDLFVKHDGALTKQYGINHKNYRGTEWFEKGKYKPVSNYLSREGQQISIGNRLNIDFLLGFQIMHQLEYVIFGLNNNDLFHKITFIKNFSTDSSYQLHRIGIDITTIKRHPSWFEQRYISNHFEWFNNFTMSTNHSLSAYYQRKNFQFLIAANNINNNIYFDENAYPQQNKENINILSAKVFKRSQFWKFGLDLNIIYHYIDNDATIRLPEITTINSFYFYHEIIKKVLWIHTGVDLTYFTAYYANAYMPSTRQFYLQNDKLIGNYPYCDFFVNFKLKRARFYFKMEHINSQLSGYNYYLVPNYPVYERGFMFGFQWLLY